MSTDSKSVQTPSEEQLAKAQEIMSVLNACTLNMPKEQTLQELHIIVERLTFIKESREGDLSESIIEDVLGGDVSEDVMKFVRWMYHRKVLGLLTGQHGRVFLRYSTRYYRKIKEIHCITAVALRESSRIKLLTHLRTIYPEPARIVFEEAPSLVLGCVIDDGTNRVDMSLMNESPRLIHKYITSLRPTRSSVHGS